MKKKAALNLQDDEKVKILVQALDNIASIESERIAHEIAGGGKMVDISTHKIATNALKKIGESIEHLRFQ